MFFESHAHYDDIKFEEDREELLTQTLPQEGVDYIVNIGADIPSSLQSIELAGQNEYIYAAVGVHPHEVEELQPKDIEQLEDLCKQPKVVAVGEIGLDYYYDYAPREQQKKWFIQQIELAKKVNLPIVVHSREAAEETYSILKEQKAHEVGGVIHCFSGSVEMARKYLQLEYYIGVGGVVTFKNAKKLVEVVKDFPLEKILLETDSPYLAPIPNRGKRNDSSNLIYIAQKIAEIKNISVEKVAEQTKENGKRFYRI